MVEPHVVAHRLVVPLSFTIYRSVNDGFNSPQEKVTTPAAVTSTPTATNARKKRESSKQNERDIPPNDEQHHVLPAQPAGKRKIGTATYVPFLFTLSVHLAVSLLL